MLTGLILILIAVWVIRRISYRPFWGGFGGLFGSRFHRRPPMDGMSGPGGFGGPGMRGPGGPGGPGMGGPGGHGGPGGPRR